MAQTVSKTFSPLDWQVDPWKDTSPVVLVTGSAGGGKSHLAMEKINGFCLKYPGAFCLIIRKTRASITNGAALFFESEIAVSRKEDPHNGVRHIANKNRFEYANGSVVVYMGLNHEDDREKLKSIGTSGGVDMVLMEEATQFDERDFNAIKGRMRGRAASWRQIILACNPDAPTHWIYTNLIQGGGANVYYSSASDNPFNPDDYLKTLAGLTGVDKLRLAEGMWVQASGLIYEDWRDHPGQMKPVYNDEGEELEALDAGNVTELADYVPGGGSVYWACDDGYSAGSKFYDGIDPISKTFTADAHPRVILLFQLKADGHLDLFEEIYLCKTLSEKQIRMAHELGYPLPEFVSVDSSAAELRGRFNMVDEYQTENGLTSVRPAMYTRKATHKVAEGIKEMRKWIAVDSNGFRRLRCHPRVNHFRKEMLSYIINPKKDTGEPLKAFDHGPDATRYKIWMLRHV